MRTGVKVTLQPLCRVRHHEADHPPPTSHSSSTRHTGRVAALGPFSRINLLRPFSFFFSRRFFFLEHGTNVAVCPRIVLLRARRSDRFKPEPEPDGLTDAVQCSAVRDPAVRCGADRAPQWCLRCGGEGRCGEHRRVVEAGWNRKGYCEFGVVEIWGEGSGDGVMMW